MSSSDDQANEEPPARPRGHNNLRIVFLLSVGFLTVLLWTGLFTEVHRMVRHQQLGAVWRDWVMILWLVLPVAIPGVVAWRFKNVPNWLMTGVIALTVASYAAVFILSSVYA